MPDDAQRRRIIASDKRSRVIFAALAIVVPLVLVLLFLRQERRLQALADHGRTTSAALTSITQRNGSSFSHYRYEVHGVAYTWNVSRDEAPFEPGDTFPITYLPEDPSLNRPGPSYSRERFEAERSIPVTRGVPLGLFAIFAAVAVLCHRNVVRLERGAALRRKPRISPDGAGRVVAVLMLACVLGVNIDPKVRAVQAAAFGASPLGVPVAIVVPIVEALLFAPFFWVFVHLMRIVMAAASRGGSLSKLEIILAVATAGPELKRSRNIVIAGFVYFVVLVGGWIAFAASRGI